MSEESSSYIFLLDLNSMTILKYIVFLPSLDFLLRPPPPFNEDFLLYIPLLYFISAFHV